MPLSPIYDEHLKIVFVGTEPGAMSDQTGHYYANPNNSFYKDLYESGFTDRIIRPVEDRALPYYHIGLDDVYNNPKALTDRLEAHKPLVVCFNSKEAVTRFLEVEDATSIRRWAGEAASNIIDFSWKPIVWALYDSSGIARQYHKRRLELLLELKKRAEGIIWDILGYEHTNLSFVHISNYTGSYRRIRVIRSDFVPMENGYVDSNKDSSVKYYICDGVFERAFDSESELIASINKDLDKGSLKYITDNLVYDIERLDLSEYIDDNNFLKLAFKYETHRVVKALALKHHKQRNKNSVNCCKLRLIIKDLEDTNFKILWEMLKSGNRNESQSASFILGEIGGRFVFKKILKNIKSRGEKSYSYSLPCLIHLVNRYNAILDDMSIPEESFETMTEESIIENNIDSASHNNYRAIMSRKQSNEYFSLIPIDDIVQMNNILYNIHDKYFSDIDKELFINDINRLIDEQYD